MEDDLALLHRRLVMLELNVRFLSGSVDDYIEHRARQRHEFKATKEEMRETLAHLESEVDLMELKRS